MVANRTDELCSALTEAGVIFKKPRGGFYLWLKVKDSNPYGTISAIEWSTEVARRSGVGLWPGDDFGGAGHVRIAITAPPAAKWQTAVRGLREVLTKTG